MRIILKEVKNEYKGNSTVDICARTDEKGKIKIYPKIYVNLGDKDEFVSQMMKERKGMKNAGMEVLKTVTNVNNVYSDLIERTCVKVNTGEIEYDNVDWWNLDL